MYLRDGGGAAVFTAALIRQNGSTPPWRSFPVRLIDGLWPVTPRGGPLGLIGARSDIRVGHPNVIPSRDFIRIHY